jgi:hypothetical protein
VLSSAALRHASGVAVHPKLMLTLVLLFGLPMVSCSAGSGSVHRPCENADLRLDLGRVAVSETDGVVVAELRLTNKIEKSCRLAGVPTARITSAVFAQSQPAPNATIQNVDGFRLNTLLGPGRSALVPLTWVGLGRGTPCFGSHADTITSFRLSVGSGGEPDLVLPATALPVAARGDCWVDPVEFGSPAPADQ